MSKNLTLIILILFSATCCIAQRHEREVMDMSLNPRDTILINSLIQQAYSARAVEPIKAIENSRRALRLSKQLKYKKGEGRALGVMGSAYYGMEDFVNALETSNEALAISEQLKDDLEIARSLNNVGAMAINQGQYDKAMECFRNAYTVARKVDDQHTMARSLNNIGQMCMEMMPTTDSAKIYVLQAIELSRKIGDDYYFCASNHTLGNLLMREGKYAEALEKYKVSLLFSKAMSESMRLEININIADVYIHQNKISEALEILNRNVFVASQKHLQQELARSYQLLAALYKQEGNPGLALDYLERYNILHDSLFNQENSNRLAIIQSQSELKNKQAQIELLTKDTLLNRDEMNRQRTELYTAIGVLIGIIFLTAILVFGYKRIQRTNVLLNQRTSELAKINATKDKLFSIISHDFRTPLNSLKAILGMVENKRLNREEFTVLAEKLRKNFNAVSNDLENLLQWSMTQLQGIQTQSTRIDVKPIVEEHISVFQEVAKAKNIHLENHIEHSLFGLADEDHIRLILRNLINNAIKFTPPGGRVEISGIQDSPFITIQVLDTGVGIASQQMESLFHKDRAISTKGTNHEKGVGLGLLLCHEFIENNGGTLQVASEPGKGSIFSFTLRAA